MGVVSEHFCFEVLCLEKVLSTMEGSPDYNKGVIILIIDVCEQHTVAAHC